MSQSATGIFNISVLCYLDAGHVKRFQDEADLVQTSTLSLGEKCLQMLYKVDVIKSQSTDLNIPSKAKICLYIFS